MTTAATAKRLLIEDRLGTPLAAWLESLRAEGWSWRLIAAELSARTQVDVTGETLRSWTETP